jgi:hypothetical protein
VIITTCADTIEQLTFDASPPRTAGLHVSTIYRSICEELDPKRFRRDGDMPWNRFEVGFTFERILEIAFASRLPHIFRPGEILCDGILLTPDGVDASGPYLVLEEYKFTWMSSRDAPDSAKFWHWRIQMMAYCYALGILRARLRALFVNGDYKGDRSPEYRVWDFTFEQWELDENWAMLRSHAIAKGWLPAA